MGKCKDLSEFDRGQIVMARQLGQSISRTATLVGCSWSAVVKSGPRKERGEPLTGSWGGQGSVKNVGSEGWPVWSYPTNELQLNKLMLVLIERCQNTQCIVVCCSWGCIVADQSGCPCWPLSITESGSNGHVSIRTGSWSNGRGWPGLMNHVFFYITWMARCVCISYLGNTWYQELHYRKKASWQRQCDALADVLLGNLGSCHPCGCYYLPKHSCRP